jgi:hypothetical protein
VDGVLPRFQYCKGPETLKFHRPEISIDFRIAAIVRIFLIASDTIALEENDTVIDVT